MLRQLALMALIAVFLSPAAVMAAATSCRDNDTQRTSFNYTVGHLGTLQNITIDKDVPCAYGCSGNSCNTDTSLAYLIVIGLLVVGIGAMRWLGLI